MKRYMSVIYLLFIFIVLVSCDKTTSSTTNSNVTTSTTENREIEMIQVITDVYTDKSRYLPDAIAKININLHNRSEDNVSGLIKVSLIHLDDVFIVEETDSLLLTKGSRESVVVEITTPNQDFTGYTILAEFIKDNQTVDLFTSALDVSSEWDKFPRYGYLVNYNANSTNIDMILKTLNKYHINGLQYYDWQYKHHLPVGYDDQGNVLESWYDIGNRMVLSNTVMTYIDKAHEYNIKSMNYNLIFGAYEDFESDQGNLEWGLYKDVNGNELDNHPLPSDWQTSKILLMNPANDDWQTYIINNMEKSFETFNFDGWHVDQLGNRGNLYDYYGNSIDLPSGYVDLLLRAKDELDVDLVFNAVDGYSQGKIAQEAPVDFLYHEVWSDNTYRDLKAIIDSNYRLTNNQKSTVLAAYMNYKSSHSSGFFNTHSVLLTNATIFASGGAHIELGDTGMLANEYFPNDNLKMSLELQEKLRKYYDFLVSYQNLLRDNITEHRTRKITIDSIKTSTLGGPDSIWYFVKEKDNLEMLHLINFLGNQNDWRDDYKQKNKPIYQENLNVKYYIEEEVKSVSVTSPDYNYGLLEDLVFENGEDDKGKFIQFTIPQLYYWDMIVVEK